MRLRFDRRALHDWLARRGAPAARAFRPLPTGRPRGVASGHELAARLVREGLAYPCYCSEAELAAMRTRQATQGAPMRYDRRCLSLYAEDRADLEAAGRKPCVRFRVPEGSLPVEGPARGTEPVRLADHEDFVLLDAEGCPAEAFSAVLERKGVMHLVRSEDDLFRTVQERLLYDALGWKAPRVVHVRST